MSVVEAPVVPETAPAAPPVTPPPVAPPAPATDPFEDDKVQSFDRPYVEKLRKEAAEHRTARRDLEKAFDKWTPDDKAIWLETVQLAGLDPKAGAEQLRRLAETLVKEEAAEAPPGEFLTAKDLDARLDKERLESETATQVRLIKQEAKSLGYEEKSEDYNRLMWVANNTTEGDLVKADAHIKAANQKILDDFVADKKAAAEGSPSTTTRSGPSGAQGEPIKTFKDAAASLEARIKAARGEGV